VDWCLAAESCADKSLCGQAPIHSLNFSDPDQNPGPVCLGSGRRIEKAAPGQYNTICLSEFVFPATNTILSRYPSTIQNLGLGSSNIVLQTLDCRRVSREYGIGSGKHKFTKAWELVQKKMEHRVQEQSRVKKPLDDKPAKKKDLLLNLSMYSLRYP
jgi:hypothetical protein